MRPHLWFINFIGLVLREALRLVLLGVALGVPAALAAARLVATQLFGISAADPSAMGLATLMDKAGLRPPI